nr:MAG TPA: hypothetical protein [Caudoviricetes sp.]
MGQFGFVKFSQVWHSLSLINLLGFIFMNLSPQNFLFYCITSENEMKSKSVATVLK